MDFSKSVLMVVVCIASCFLLAGCQTKRSDAGPATERSVEPAQTGDQDSSTEAAPMANSQVTPNEQQPVAHSGDMNQPTMEGAQDGAASSTEQSEQSDDDVGVSFGRMMGGLFRATRSLVPIPAATSEEHQVESSDEAPRFPQP